MAMTTLPTLTLLRPVKVAEVAAGEEAQIGAEGELIGAPEPVITVAKSAIYRGSALSLLRLVRTT
jgi:hypothetical protein